MKDALYAAGMLALWISMPVLYIIGLVSQAEAGAWLWFVLGMVIPPLGVILGFFSLMS